jgi:cysteine sulfinate desulfinase/cysteine desulfurase-like protein
VLTALGILRNAAYGVLRISMGHTTTREEVDAFIDALVAVVKA